MLPKLQQSSLAQSLRRDNPATLVQSTINLIKPRINLKTLWENPIMSHISPGKINLLLKILIQPLVTSQLSIYLRRSSNKKGILLTNNLLFQVLSINTKGWEEMEEKLLLLYKRKINFSLHLQKAEHFRRDKSLPPNFVVTMIEEICQSGSTIKVHSLNSFGKYQHKVLIIIIICLYFLMVLAKN